MRYEGNPKHKEPWQPGRKGSLCPAWSHKEASVLLADGIVEGQRRYATMKGMAFAAQQHSPGTWHGYPVSWSEVPQKIWRAWLKTGEVKRSQLNKSWDKVDAETDE